GQAVVSPTAELVVEFAEVDRDDSLGTCIACETEFCEMPPAKSIPDLEARRQRVAGLGLDLSAIYTDPLNRLNSAYFRELATYEFARRLYRPIRLLVRNAGRAAASAVRVELVLSSDADAVLLDASDMPDAPKR